jgi:hypothetical protein
VIDLLIVQITSGSTVAGALPAAADFLYKGRQGLEKV